MTTEHSTLNPLDDHREIFAVVVIYEFREEPRDKVIGPYSARYPEFSDDEACDWLRETLERQGEDVGRVWVARSEAPCADRSLSPR